ncbi:phosphoadenosine phosphosulfate reductase [Sporomusaceae bacterium BoRhaA]|uniref:phosphoadenosine phosphosulfate reductase family protein n=1 Tax=Pelorhabdus rhamnosifermentans TaxID=2772457 RepID=UPI001C063E69|nr:phosphoadenosine phosphosulfate reductase family protein [Pelorhabdus rhamnosifermentans]MBU2703668.1 phosphoadenosine phosphosulfate reductase [Pelorhabdus rhamnosifermentans]
MLTEKTLFGNVDKVQTAIDRIKQFEPPEGYYVAFSGGKDSCVVLDLVKRAGVKYDAHYNLTTVDPPELVYFIRDNFRVTGRRIRYRQRLKAARLMGRKSPRPFLTINVHKPKETMWQLIVKKRIPPLRHMRYCCAILKEGGGKGRIVITGVRWAESARRAKRRMVEQCNRDNSKQYLHPIIDWSEDDVWQYIHQNKVPYCSLYDEGFKRLGCVLCPYARGQNKQLELKRWPKIADAYKRACVKAFNKAVADGLVQRNWKSGEDMYEWWIAGKSSVKQNPDQTVIFE